MAYPSTKNFSTVLAITIAISCLFSCVFAEAEKGGFSVELINRDSPNSPFYNPHETPAQRAANAFRRSFNRLNHLYPKSAEVSPNSPRTTVISNSGEYLVKLSIGTPPFEIKAIADTGSDLIWTQCRPCHHCYKQDAPLFAPRSSKTYRNLPCRSKQCNYFSAFSHSCSRKGDCHYSYSYGDKSFTSGNLAADTVTLGSTTGHPVSFPTTTFGCGFSNGGTFNEKGSGVVGLGGGPLSLVRQLDHVIDGKFSYCLVPFTSHKNTSTLSFGSNAVISGKGVVSTPIIPGRIDTFYYLDLEAVSVGNTKIPFASSVGAPSNGSRGNIIIDSGTTLSVVPRSFYLKLESAVLKAVVGQRVRPPAGVPAALCYKTRSLGRVPKITVHFKGGADLQLYSPTLFLQVAKDVTCFTFAAGSDAAFGNLAQSNFLVSYDLKRKIVSFKPKDCSRA